MPSAKITSKGRVTIPHRVRAALGVDAGDRLEFVEIEKGQFAIIPVTGSVQELKGMVRSRRKKPVSLKEMDSAIAKGATESL